MKQANDRESGLVGRLGGFMRSYLFKVLRIGPIPTHLSFIMDGNRRFAKKMNIGEGDGHRAGFFALISMLRYCYELGVTYVSIYAFSIDNFKRRPEEVKIIMDLILEKIEGLLEEGSLANQYGVRVYFVGNLKLLTEPVRVAAEKVMESTSRNTERVLLIGLAYTSRDEIVHSVHRACRDRLEDLDDDDKIEVAGIEKHMHMGVTPDPDLLMRSSGEKRLSNYQLWQTTECLLYAPRALWPEIGLWHMVFGILKYQRGFGYFEKKEKR